MSAKNKSRMYEAIIESGIIFLLIYTPLAFGGVSQRSIMLLEIVSGVLLIVWFAKVISQRKKGYSSTDSQRKHIFLISTPFIVAIALFFALILLQFVPLPDFLIKIISPASYRIYTEGASYTASAAPNLLPLSVCTQATEEEFYKFLAYAAIFFLIVNNIRTSKQMNRLVYLIIAVAFLESLYGLIQFVSGQHFIYSYKMKSFWVQGTFVNKNHFAGYMEMAILLMFGMLFTRFEKRSSSPLRNIEQTFEEKYMKVFFVLFVLFIMISAHLLSGSRGGVISFSFGMMVFVFLVYNRRLLRKWIMIVLIFLPLVAVMLLMIVPEQFIASLTRFSEQQFDPSFQVRWEIWRTQGHIFQDFPIGGSGFGAFSHLARRYQTFRWSHRLAHSESDFMQLLAETGIVGTVLVAWMGAMFFYYILSMWKRRRSRWVLAITAGGLSAIVSIVIHGGFDFNLHIPANALLLSVIAALSYVTVHIQRAEGQSAVGSRQSAVGSRQSMYRLVIPVGVLVLFYLFRVTESYYAFGHYRQFTYAVQEEDTPSVTAIQHDYIIDHIKKAIRHDRNNAEYYFALGSYLYRYYADIQDAEAIEHKEQGFHEAEGWLHKAIMLDPANPGYYYEMGRLSDSRGDCSPPIPRGEQGGKCPAALYFLAALNNAPKNMFLRKVVGRWFYHYNQETGYQFLREILSRDTEDTPESPRIAREFSKFLYEIHMDYESDREAKRALHLEKGEPEECKASFAPRSKINFALQEEIELGNDDGSAEWRTALTSETQRVKKVICLPENLDEYNYSAVKIFMNNGGGRHFITHISIDDQLIRQYHRTVPRVRNWHEIPFDKNLLQGKSSINVYIRVTGVSEAGNYLEIWGDHDIPNRHSVFNFNTKDDLSSDEGIQTGEYMIRLVLKK